MNKERLIDQFMEMVQVDSETGHEREIADYLLKIFKEMDVEVYDRIRRRQHFRAFQG